MTRDEIDGVLNQIKALFRVFGGYGSIHRRGHVISFYVMEDGRVRFRVDGKITSVTKVGDLFNEPSRLR